MFDDFLINMFTGYKLLLYGSIIFTNRNVVYLNQLLLSRLQHHCKT